MKTCYLINVGSAFLLLMCPFHAITAGKGTLHACYRDGLTVSCVKLL